MEHSVIQILLEAFQKNRLPQSILFYGESTKNFDSYTTPLFQQILDTNLNPEAHPDYFALYPTGKMQIIKIEMIRELIKKVQHSANQGGRKIVVIHEADKMNSSSANAFLKTLEEPPDDTILFLFTSKLYSVLETIRSRCLKFKISSELPVISIPSWNSWFEEYEAWLHKVHLKVRDRLEIAELVLNAYALTAKMENILKELAKQDWNALKDQLPEHLDEDSMIAMETASEKGARSRFLQELERANQQIFRKILQQENTAPVIKLARTTDCLEKLNGLMGVNFNQANAMENYFLNALRIWSAK